MRQLNEIIPQNIKRTGSNNWHTKTSKGHNEDYRRDNYNDYRDGENHSED